MHTSIEQKAIEIALRKHQEKALCLDLEEHDKYNDVKRLAIETDRPDVLEQLCGNSFLSFISKDAYKMVKNKAYKLLWNYTKKYFSVLDSFEKLAILETNDFDKIREYFEDFNIRFEYLTDLTDGQSILTEIQDRKILDLMISRGFDAKTFYTEHCPVRYCTVKYCIEHDIPFDKNESLEIAIKHFDRNAVGLLLENTNFDWIYDKQTTNLCRMIDLMQKNGMEEYAQFLFDNSHLVDEESCLHRNMKAKMKRLVSVSKEQLAYEEFFKNMMNSSLNSLENVPLSWLTTYGFESVVFPTFNGNFMGLDYVLQNTETKFEPAMIETLWNNICFYEKVELGKEFLNRISTYYDIVELLHISFSNKCSSLTIAVLENGLKGTQNEQRMERFLEEMEQHDGIGLCVANRDIKTLKYVFRTFTKRQIKRLMIDICPHVVGMTSPKILDLLRKNKYDTTEICGCTGQNTSLLEVCYDYANLPLLKHIENSNIPVRKLDEITSLFYSLEEYTLVHKYDEIGRNRITLEKDRKLNSWWYCNKTERVRECIRTIAKKWRPKSLKEDLILWTYIEDRVANRDPIPNLERLSKTRKGTYGLDYFVSFCLHLEPIFEINTELFDWFYNYSQSCYKLDYFIETLLSVCTAEDRCNIFNRRLDYLKQKKTRISDKGCERVVTFMFSSYRSGTNEEIRKMITSLLNYPYIQSKFFLFTVFMDSVANSNLIFEILQEQKMNLSYNNEFLLSYCIDNEPRFVKRLISPKTNIYARGIYKRMLNDPTLRDLIPHYEEKAFFSCISTEQIDFREFL